MMRCIVGLWLLIAVTLSANAVELKGVGIAPIVTSEAEARAVALEQAKRSIIEQAFGTFVEARTSSENFIMASDLVQSSSSGRIERYRILSEKSDGGDYRVVISAVVDTRRVISEVAETISATGVMKKPQVVVEITGEAGPMANAYAAQITQELQKKFRDDGYRVITSDDKESSFALSGRIGVDEYQSEVHGVSLKSQTVSASVVLTRRGSSNVLAVASFNDNGASGPHARSMRRLVVAASNSLYEELTNPLLQTWQDPANLQSELKVVVNGLSSLLNAEEAKIWLENSLPGVYEVDLLDFEGGRAEYQCDYAGWPEQFYAELKIAISEGTAPVILTSVGDARAVLTFN